MYRLLSSGSSVSIIWVIRSMPSVATFRTWVSPRLNRPEPWALGMKPTSQEIWRISSTLRPSSRTPSSTIRLRIAFFWRSLKAGDMWRSSSAYRSGPHSAARCSLSSAFSVSRLDSRSAFAWTSAPAKRGPAKA